MKASSMSPVEVTFSVLLGLSAAHFALGTLMFVRSRRKHPVKGHSLPLVCLSVVAISGITLVNAASHAGLGVPCWARLVFVFDFTTLATVLYITRAWRVFIYYRQQAEKLNLAARAQRRLSHMRTASRSAVFSISKSEAKDTTAAEGAAIPRSEAKDTAAAASAMSSPSVREIDKDTAAAVAATAAAASAMSVAVSSPSVRKIGKDTKQGKGRLNKSTCARQPDGILAWFNDWKLFSIAVGCSIVLMNAQNVPFLLIGEYGNTFSVVDLDTCMETTMSIYITSGILGIAILFVFYTLYKLRLVSDGYLIKSELARDTVWGTTCVVVYALPASFTKLAGTQLFMTVLGNMLMFHTVTWKVYCARHTYKRMGNNGQSARSLASAAREYTLESVLANQAACAKFEKHLHHEWAVENLLFYRAAQQYARQCASESRVSAARRTRMAQSIYNQFIVENAPSMVNISAKRRDQVINDVGSLPATSPPSADVFSAACADVFKLMQMDSFMRFRLENSYEDLFGGSTYFGEAGNKLSVVVGLTTLTVNQSRGSFPAISTSTSREMKLSC